MDVCGDDPVGDELDAGAASGAWLLRFSVWLPLAISGMIAGLAALGIDQAIFSMPNVYEPEPFELLAEIVPQVEKIRVAGR